METPAPTPVDLIRRSETLTGIVRTGLGCGGQPVEAAFDPAEVWPALTNDGWEGV